MVSTGNLYKLIHQLSSSEKGYIKKHLNINSTANKKNLAVFDAVEKHKVFDEQLLKQKAGQKDFHQAVDALFGIALSCIESYHNNEKKGIRSALNQIEILIEKNLYHQAEKIITKVKTLTDKKKYYDLYSEVSEWEITLMGSKPPTDELQKTFDRIFERLEVDIVKQEEEMQD